MNIYLQCLESGVLSHCSFDAVSKHYWSRNYKLITVIIIRCRMTSRWSPKLDGKSPIVLWNSSFSAIEAFSFGTYMLVITALHPRIVRFLLMILWDMAFQFVILFQYSLFIRIAIPLLSLWLLKRHCRCVYSRLSFHFRCLSILFNFVRLMPPMMSFIYMTNLVPKFINVFNCLSRCTCNPFMLRSFRLEVSAILFCFYK